MDNDDLLFNLMYFDDGHAPTLGSMMNSVQQETLALHSSNNTPYKLKPATDNAIAGLKAEIFCYRDGDSSRERECAVCKDEMEDGCCIVRLPACSHYFHQDCLFRWISLQGWCPVCRTDIVAVSEDAPGDCACLREGCEQTVALSVDGMADEMETGAFLPPKQLFRDDDDVGRGIERGSTKDITIQRLPQTPRSTVTDD